MITHVRNSRSSNTGHDDHSGRISHIARLSEHWREEPDQIEDTADIDIKHFLRAPVRRWLERSSPCGSSVGDEDVETRFVLFDFAHKSLNVFDLRNVGRYADGLAFDPR